MGADWPGGGAAYAVEGDWGAASPRKVRCSCPAQPGFRVRSSPPDGCAEVLTAAAVMPEEVAPSRCDECFGRFLDGLE